MPPRARALPPDERRAAILAAVEPVVLDKGLAATTRELAQAAGVAEGTLFRVFDSKDELVLACGRGAFARRDHLDRFAAIDRSLPVEERLIAIVRILQGVLGRIHRVMMTFEADKERLGHPRHLVDPEVLQHSERLMCAVLEPDADRLRLPLTEVVRILRSLTMAGLHPAGIGRPLEAEQIVDIVLHGVLDPNSG